MAATDPIDDQKWANRQRHLTDATTGLTAAGATALGVMLAGKTKAGKKVLPKKLYQKLNTERADDLRNTVALASMIGGVASGAHWSKKLKSDAERPAAPAVPVPQDKALNMAKAMGTDIDKALVAGGIRVGRKYPWARHVSYRGYIRNPNRKYLKGVTR